MWGDEVEVVFTKWDGSPHWHVPARWLGEDEHGTWLHSPAGTDTWRPGARLRYEHSSVVCIPNDQHWVATLYDTTEPGAMGIYVDISTPATWSDGEVRMVDLDLDVVLRRGGTAFVDDEDEFAVHRERYGYPSAVIDAAEATCAEVLAAVTAGRGPFDALTARTWLDRADPGWAPVPSRTTPPGG